jgi:Double-GTPase 1
VNSQSSGSSLLEKRSEFCGWYPKPEPTHPVLFIGSPGTGKSSVMVTGLTSFSTCRTTMRLKVEGVSKEDRAMIDHYQKSFFDGILPKRTETNVRYTVQLAIEDIRNLKNRVNFVFTDIPGEIAASGIQGQGTDPIVQSVLKTAETIVFFFDLGLEPSIFKALDLGSNKQAWKYMCDQYRKLQENRPAKVNQTDLLNRIMEEIREMRGWSGRTTDLGTEFEFKVMCHRSLLPL